MHDIFAIEEAKKTIGDYKLKTSPTFSLLSEERDTLFSKYKQLLNCRKKVRIISPHSFLITCVIAHFIANTRTYINWKKLFYTYALIALLSTRSFQREIESCKNRERTFAYGSCTFKKISQTYSCRNTIEKYKIFPRYSYVEYKHRISREKNDGVY